jgi:hypothetical protein
MVSWEQEALVCTVEWKHITVMYSTFQKARREDFERFLPQGMINV